MATQTARRIFSAPAYDLLPTELRATLPRWAGAGASPGSASGSARETAATMTIDDRVWIYDGEEAAAHEALLLRQETPAGWHSFTCDDCGGRYAADMDDARSAGCPRCALENER